MAPAPAASSRRRSPGAAPRPRPGSTVSPRSRWLIAVGVGVLLLSAYLLYSRRAGASGGLFDTSGTPGRDLAGSGAQQPNGGASSVPGALPPFFVDQPADPVSTQVQTTDAGASSQQSSSTAAATSTATSGYSYIGAPSTVNGVPVTETVTIGGRGYEQSSPGSDYYMPVPLSEAAPVTTIHKPGLQM